MSRILIFWCLLALWVLLLALSVIVPANTPPADFGFTAGLNRVMLFFQFQIGAFFVGIMLWFVAAGLEQRRLKWLGRAPALLALAFVGLLVVFVIYANLTKPAPQGPVVTPAGPAPSAAPAETGTEAAD
ncbi:MAG: hypothetical protein ACU0DK_07220 [Pseudooceanicola sp.]